MTATKRDVSSVLWFRHTDRVEDLPALVRLAMDTGTHICLTISAAAVCGVPEYLSEDRVSLRGTFGWPGGVVGVREITHMSGPATLLTMLHPDPAAPSDAEQLALMGLSAHG